MSRAPAHCTSKPSRAQGCSRGINRLEWAGSLGRGARFYRRVFTKTKIRRAALPLGLSQ